MNTLERQEIEEKFEAAQQAQIDNFKEKLKKAANEVLGEIYTDVSMYACSDAHINYYNVLRDEFRANLIEDVLHQKHGWAESVRKELLAKHKDELQAQIISDLMDQVKNLQDWLNERDRWRQ